MGYGSTENLTIRVDEELPQLPDKTKTVKYVLTTTSAIPFGMIIRMLNAHSIPYEIIGEAIHVPEPRPFTGPVVVKAERVG